MKGNIELLRFNLQNYAVDKPLFDSRVVRLSQKLDSQIYVYQKILSYQLDVYYQKAL
ncbi:aspartyl-phosphate phosphatase Spo0E family protein [Desulfotomaculum sp. 1211_IL3151]|uniref:aspartyl-phosphate phosphatase Spo0E family protein n=1 Tax=Desulfotomaculum sp. 1211_IL3151 TaxID=3084055 RepID=UPI003FA5CB17